MLPMHAFKAVSTSSFRSQLPLRLAPRTYATVSTGDKDAADLNTARSWYSHFNKSTIPMRIAKTKFVKAPGPRGPKGEKINPKSITLWPMKFLAPQVPKLLHPGLYASSYYVPSLDSIQIDCDTYPSQHENEEETHRRLEQEIRRIYKASLPGATPPVRKQEIDELLSMPRGGMKKFFHQNHIHGRESKLLREQIAKDKQAKKRLRERALQNSNPKK